MNTSNVSKIKTLGDVLPKEFLSGEYDDTKAFSLRDEIVVAEYDSWNHPWIGKERNVHSWYLLENRWVVGWNENPGRGWSFPVKRISPYFLALYTATPTIPF